MKIARTSSPFRAVTLTALVALLCVPPAAAFEVIGAVWPRNVVNFQVNPNFPADPGGSREVQEGSLVCGAEVWHEQSESLFRFNYQGRSTRAGFNLDDGVNNVSWQDRDLGEALAATILNGIGARAISFDIVFFSETDGEANEWSAGRDTPTRQWDILGVAAHEFGHALGLDHTEVLQATMFGGARSRGQPLRTLQADDQDGVETLYGTRVGADVSVELFSATPNFGPLAGDNRVRLEGRNFSWTDDTALRVDGESVSRTQFNVIDCEHLEILSMPSGSEEGPVDITIVNELGTHTLVGGYRYGLPGPSLSSVEPNFGPVSGGTRVTVRGENFEDTARVSVGGRSMSDLIVLDSETIIGTLPSATSAGLVDVVLEQGPDRAELPQAFSYESNWLVIENTVGGIGEALLPVRVLATNDQTLAGISFAFVFDATDVTIDDVVVEGTEAADAEFHAARVDNDAGTATFGLVMSLQSTTPNLPAAENRHVATILSTLADGLAVGDEIDLTLESGAGAPPIEIQFSLPGSPTPILPISRSGVISVAEAALFIRGDSNVSGGLDISDAVGLLDTLFRGGSPFACADAADANDDGDNDISDGVAILHFLFTGGSAPAAPYPNPGTDPTPDDLECSSGL